MTIKSLAKGSKYFKKGISKVELLGYGNVNFERKGDALIVTLPEPTDNIMPVLKIKK